LAIMEILETDTLCLLEVAIRTLVQVIEGTMDETLLQSHLSSWRKVLTGYSIELPRIQTSLKNFGDFSESCGISGDLQSRIYVLRQRIEETMRQTEKVDASLRTEMSIIESRRGIAEAESVSKLTELAFIFIPISFAASVFGMQFKEFQIPPPIYAFVIAALVALGISYSIRLSIRSVVVVKGKGALLNATRQYANITNGVPVPTHDLVLYLIWGSWEERRIDLWLWFKYEWHNRLRPWLEEWWEFKLKSWLREWWVSSWSPRRWGLSWKWQRRQHEIGIIGEEDPSNT